MKKPKMIIFDYGHTLLCEPGFDMLRGEEALFKHIKRNKNGLTPKAVSEFHQEIWEKIAGARNAGLELHQMQYQQFIYEYLEIEHSVSMAEAERIFWDNASPGARMPNVEKMLDCLREKGIRSGVISNIGWSGAALTERINRLLPNNRFEFIIASSEYMFRKPSPLIFELALRKAGLSASDVWYCGDNIIPDVEGAAGVGIFPVWYEDESMENPWRWGKKGDLPGCPHLHIHDWQELIETLEAFV